MNTEKRIIIEQMIDESGMENFLDAVETVCYDKADHLRTNWQDEYAAKQWEKTASKIETVICYLRKS